MASIVSHLADVMDAFHHLIVMMKSTKRSSVVILKRSLPTSKLPVFKIIDNLHERFKCQSSVLCGYARIHNLELFCKVAKTVNLTESVDITQKIEVLHIYIVLISQNNIASCCQRASANRLSAASPCPSAFDGSDASGKGLLERERNVIHY
jgi:hypothetical protein